MALLELPFEVMAADVDEENTGITEPDELVCTLAAMKAEKVARVITDHGSPSKWAGRQITDEGIVIIGADTMVSIDNQLIGKPVNRQDAKDIISKLAGRTHEIWTGICVLDADTKERVIEVERTEVSFWAVGDKELEKYLDSKDWAGKAGGYQVQGAIKPFVKDVVGSYTNVIGLPMVTLVEMLEKMGVWVEVEVEEVLAAKLGRPN